MSRTTIAILTTLAVLAASCGGGDEPAKKTGSPTKQPPKKAAGGGDTAKKSSGGGGSSVDVNRSQILGLFGEWPKAPEVSVRLSSARVNLGRELYHEKALSKGKDISCATCHDVDNWGIDGKKTSPGTGGLIGKRNSPTTFNAFRQFRQFWDGRAATVEEQSTMPMMTDVEHGLASEDEIVSILKGIDKYEPMFKAAFKRDKDDPITADNVRAAIGAYERKLVTVSPWDRYLDGDDSALTDEQKRGLNEFVKVGCATCHMGRGLGGTDFKKLGDKIPVESEDKGRFEVTGNETDMYLFKVPMLLNVEKTAPYYHDGSIATLEESVKHMAKHQLEVDLTDAQVASITAFLGALTGELQFK